MNIRLTEKERKKFTAKLDSIAEITKREHIKPGISGVLGGVGGTALFQFYYSKFRNQEEYADLAIAKLKRVIDGLGEEFNLLTFCDGIAGFGWTLDHLEQQGFIEDTSDVILSELDAFMYNRMVVDIEVENYDFLHGALGYGFYFFKRYKSTSSNLLRSKYKQYLLLLVNNLVDSSLRDKNGIKWKSRAHLRSQEKLYNFGLAHGMASIINFFSRLNLHEDFKSEVGTPLKENVSYILSFMNLDSNENSLFPSTVKDNEKISYNSRLGWCYGDLGIGISMWHASKSLRDENLKKKALDILLHSAGRISPANTFVRDAMLCHGSFGISQIFNRVNEQQKNKIFEKSAKFWANDGLKKAVHQNGHAGYKKWMANDLVWKSETKVLTGIEGIGLSIISLLSGDNSWDECMMIG